jgi:hypothetical protein
MGMVLRLATELAARQRPSHPSARRHRLAPLGGAAGENRWAKKSQRDHRRERKLKRNIHQRERLLDEQDQRGEGDAGCQRERAIDQHRAQRRRRHESRAQVAIASPVSKVYSTTAGSDSAAASAVAFTRKAHAGTNMARRRNSPKTSAATTARCRPETDRTWVAPAARKPSSTSGDTSVRSPNTMVRTNAAAGTSEALIDHPRHGRTQAKGHPSRLPVPGLYPGHELDVRSGSHAGEQVHALGLGEKACVGQAWIGEPARQEEPRRKRHLVPGASPARPLPRSPTP